MTARRRRLRLFAGIALTGLVTGFLAGMATDRVRHDRERSIVLARYEQALQQWRAHLMAIEREPHP